MIIALSGKARSGKDSFADVLTSKYNFEKLALADPIRELASKVFGIPLSTFTSDQLKEMNFVYPIILDEGYLGHIIDIVENDWGFKVDEDAKAGMMKQLGAEFIHPRKILQTVGTEIIRNNLDKDIFLKLADKRIDKTTRNVVITDCRFSNEREWFKKQNATLCLIKRPQLTFTDGHSSENDLGADTEYDVIITNDECLNRFQIEVGEWMNARLQRMSY